MATIANGCSNGVAELERRVETMLGLGLEGLRDDALELDRRMRAPTRKLPRELRHSILKTRQPVQQQSSGGVDIRSDGRSLSTR